MEGCAMGRHLGDGFHPRRSRITTQPASPPPRPSSGLERLTIEVRNTKQLFHNDKMIGCTSNLTPIHNPLISVITAVLTVSATSGRCHIAVPAQRLPPNPLEL